MAQNPPKEIRGRFAPRYNIPKLAKYIEDRNGGVVPAYDQIRSKIQQLRVNDRGEWSFTAIS
jgi:hypothetical protein